MQNLNIKEMKPRGQTLGLAVVVSMLVAGGLGLFVAAQDKTDPNALSGDAKAEILKLQLDEASLTSQMAQIQLQIEQSSAGKQFDADQAQLQHDAQELQTAKTRIITTAGRKVEDTDIDLEKLVFVPKAKSADPSLAATKSATPMAAPEKPAAPAPKK